MADFQEALNKILSSPEDMEKIANLAKSFGLGESLDSSNSEPAYASAPASNDDYTPPPVKITQENVQSAIAGLDPNLMGKIIGLMQAYNGKSDKAALIEALSPFLKNEQRGKLARAAEAARLARVAKAAFGDLGIK